jgi:uncharacterized protein (UPF0335 family)
MSEVGHNSIVREKLEQIIESMEEQNAVKADASEMQKAIMAEAKALGYDTKAIRALITLRKRDPNDLAEEEAILDIYKEALGM